MSHSFSGTYIMRALIEAPNKATQFWTYHFNPTFTEIPLLTLHFYLGILKCVMAWPQWQLHDARKIHDKACYVISVCNPLISFWGWLCCGKSNITYAVNNKKKNKKKFAIFWASELINLGVEKYDENRKWKCEPLFMFILIYHQFHIWIWTQLLLNFLRSVLKFFFDIKIMIHPKIRIEKTRLKDLIMRRQYCYTTKPNQKNIRRWHTKIANKSIIM